MRSTTPGRPGLLLLLSAATGVLLAAPALAQGGAQGAQGAPPPAAPPATFPDTPLGRLGRELVDVVNSGDSAAVARFVDAHLGVDVARGRTPADYTRMLTKTYAQSGGLRLERVRMAGPALRVFTRAANGRRYLGIELVPSPTDTARVVELGLHPMDGLMRMPPAPWATEPLADDRLAAVIRERVRQAADSDRFSGVVLVARGDRVLVHEPLGFADRARGRRNAPATTFQTTSVGKMFTGVAVMQLVERGKLRLDDTVAAVLPEYPNREAARRITVRQLLTHTAGVPEPFFSPRFGAAPKGATHVELLATFADAPLDGEPGAGHRYSNGNYLTLAAIVERVSGLRYEEYLRRHVWGPAGMRHVAHPAWTDAPERAVGYARFTQHDPLGVEPRTAAPVHASREHLRGFGGGAFAAEDLFRFAHALRSGKLLRAGGADSVTAGQVAVGGPVKYALGFYEQRMHGTRVVGHPGSNPDTGFDSDVEMVWDGEWTVVVLSNYDAPAGMELSGPILDLLARQTAMAKGAKGGAAQAPGAAGAR